MAIRYCTQLGVWESPSLINCTTEAFTSASSEVMITQCKFESAFDTSNSLDIKAFN